MAIYQFTIEFIPNAWVEKEKTVDSLFNGDLYDLSPAWKAYKPLHNVGQLISQILPKGKSWHPELQIWGNEKSNDIQVWSRNNQIDSIKIRLGLGGEIESFKLQIIELAKQLNCQLFIPELKKIIPPEINLLNETISNSRAAAFIDNPKKFLEGI